MALWSLPYGARTWAPPESSSAPAPVSVVAGGTAHAKGSYVEAVASTSEPVVGVWVQSGAVGTTSGTDTATLLDIAIGGAGAEVVVVANLQIGFDLGTFSSGYYLPIALPGGVRIAMRSQSAVASKSIGVRLAPVYGQSASGVASFGSCVTYGANTATSKGVTFTVGAGSEGSWAEIVAATSRPIRALAFCPAHDATAITARETYYDIGVGASGSEVVVIPNLYASLTSSEGFWSALLGVVPLGLTIPEGARLAVRASAAGANNAAAHVVAFN